MTISPVYLGVPTKKSTYPSSWRSDFFSTLIPANQPSSGRRGIPLRLNANDPTYRSFVPSLWNSSPVLNALRACRSLSACIMKRWWRRSDSAVTSSAPSNASRANSFCGVNCANILNWANVGHRPVLNSVEIWESDIVSETTFQRAVSAEQPMSKWERRSALCVAEQGEWTPFWRCSSEQFSLPNILNY